MINKQSVHETNSQNGKKRPNFHKGNDNRTKTKKPKLECKLFETSSSVSEIKNDLNNFLEIIEDEGSKEEKIRLYLKNGGNLQEVIELIENPAYENALLFNLINKVLLQIHTNHTNHANIAIKAGESILSLKIGAINAMLKARSKPDERLAALRILTTIATTSSTLARNILQSVSFNKDNIEVLAGLVDGKLEIRTAFIHFIAAFLIDGHFAAFAALLAQNGLLTSIIPGLMYDEAETVVLVLTAMKTHILENALVSKSQKMEIFNTRIVREIVKLYNWSGVNRIDDLYLSKASVNTMGKIQVSEAAHDFLLILCTSVRFGVVFRDPTLGLAKKSYNPLMLSVVESLQKPWHHSYASDLVIKICRACPDLAKTVWANLNGFLKPRLSGQWLQAMKFAGDLATQFGPECIEPHVHDLNVYQIRQIVINLASPPSIIKRLIPEGYERIEHQTIKFHILKLLYQMAKVLAAHKKQARNWVNIDSTILDAALLNHCETKFPDIKFILHDWQKTDNLDENEVKACTVGDHLGACFDLFSVYRELAPDLLQTVDFSENSRVLLSESARFSADENELRKLQVKGIKLYLESDNSLFSAKNELFFVSIRLSLQFYYETQDLLTREVLHSLLESTHFFDGFEDEISFWVDGVLNLNSFDSKISDFLIDFIIFIQVNALKYRNLASECKLNLLVLALTDFFESNLNNKAVKTYLNFVFLNLIHAQTDFGALNEVLAKVAFLSSDLLNYCQNWAQNECSPLSKLKGRLTPQFSDFSTAFLDAQLEDYDYSLYPNLRVDLAQAGVFYFSQLVKSNGIQDRHYDNLTSFIDKLHEDVAFNNGIYCKIILGNALLLENFSLVDANYSTRLIHKLVKRLKTDGNAKIGAYLPRYRAKIVAVLCKMFKKPAKYVGKAISIELMATFELDYEQCAKLVGRFLENEENCCFINVVVYCLQRIAFLAANNYKLAPLSLEVVAQLSKCVSGLAAADIGDVCAALWNYLRTFPHCIGAIDGALFERLLKTGDYHAESLKLCGLLVERRADFFPAFVANLDEVCAKRSFILALLEAVMARGADDALLARIFAHLEPQVAKALQKPHKAGQLIQLHHKAIGVLVGKFMKVPNFGNQVQKFEASEVFHAHLLNVVYARMEEKSTKQTGNVIQTFIHLLNGLLKQKSGLKPVGGVREMCEIFTNLLDGLDADFELKMNPAIKLLAKFCLKYGVDGDGADLLAILARLVGICYKEVADGGELFEMMMSHSQFLDVVLSDANKKELMNLWLVLCDKFPELMERSHIPILLGAYKASRSEQDLINLKLLKMYASRPDQTDFYNFKPFLWNEAAISHYSIHQTRAQTLKKQPKIYDGLSILEYKKILLTIQKPTSPNSYDLDFFLPLFCHLLAPESPVSAYYFVRSGALALTLTALRDDEKARRLAACQVLARLHFHTEARRGQKDKVLWLRFLEAVAAGVAADAALKVSNFAAVHLALSSLVLTQPQHAMYVPLTDYLLAKSRPDFGAIPELYTFLHSPDVRSREHRLFLLEVVKTGLRGEADVRILLHTMGFKLVSELASSSLADDEVRLFVLEVLEACAGSDWGARFLCGKLSFLAQVTNLLASRPLANDRIVYKLVEILRRLVENDADKHRNFIVYLNCLGVLEDGRFGELKGDVLELLYRVLSIVVGRFRGFLRKEHLGLLLAKCNDSFCRYLVDYGCEFVRETDFERNRALYSIIYTKINV